MMVEKTNLQEQEPANKNRIEQIYLGIKKQPKTIRHQMEDIEKAKPYSNTTKRCNLCMEEKYIIMFKPEMASLNQRGGVVTSCLHLRKFFLANHPV